MADIDVDGFNEGLKKLQETFGITDTTLEAFVKMTAKSTKEFKKQIEELNKEIKKGKKGYEDQKKLLTELNEALEELGDTTDDAGKTTRKQSLLAERDALAHSAMMRGVTEDVTAGVSKSVIAMSYGAGAFVKGLQANQSAAQLSGDIFKVGIDIAAAGVKTLGGITEKVGDKMLTSANPIISTIGLFVAGAGMLAQASAEAAAKIAKFGVDVLQAEVEKTYKAFNSMSASGAMFADGMTGMRNSAIGAGLTVDQFAGVLKEQSANIATAGLGVTEGAKAVGRVGADLKKSGVRDQLMKLGYGFEEQAGLIAETIANIRRSGSGTKATDAQVAEQTQKYAENLRLIASITGEDAKKKEAEAAEAAKDLAFRQKLAGKSVEQQAQINLAMATMTTQERKNFTDRIVLGGVINTEGAIYEATVDGARAKGDKLADLFNKNNLNAKTAADANAEYGKQISKSILSQDAIATAGYALHGQLGDVSKGMSEVLDANNKYTTEGVKAGEAATKAAEKTKDGLTKGVVGAEQAAQDLKTALQEVLTPAIMDFASVSQKMLKAVKDSLNDLGYGQTKEQKATNEKNTKEMKSQYNEKYGGFGEMRYQADVKAWNDEQARLTKMNELKAAGDEEGYNAMLADNEDAKKKRANLREATNGQYGQEAGPSMVEDYMKGITKHAKGGSIRAGATGLVGEEGPELIQGPAAITPNLTTEQLIIAIDALREMKGVRFGENDFDAVVAMSEGRMKVLQDRIKPANGTSLASLEKAFASSADYKPIGDAKAAMGFAKGGVASGSLGGYQAELHGTEAVVPLPDGKSIPVKLDSSSLTASMQEQTGLLNSILTSLNKGNSLSSGILQNSY